MTLATGALQPELSRSCLQALHLHGDPNFGLQTLGVGDPVE